MSHAILDTTFESERTFTQAEFAAWVAAHETDLQRFELLNGRIVMTPPSSWPGGEVGARVIVVLGTFLRSRRLGRLFGPEQGFELPSGDTLAPDAAFVSNERWEESGPHEVGKFLRIVPELAVEVASPSSVSRDRGEKKAIYERNGVREYWLVDPLQRSLVRYNLSGDRYGSPRRFEETDTVDSAVLAELRFAFSELLP